MDIVNISAVWFSNSSMTQRIISGTSAFSSDINVWTERLFIQSTSQYASTEKFYL